MDLKDRKIYVYISTQNIKSFIFSAINLSVINGLINYLTLWQLGKRRCQLFLQVCIWLGRHQQLYVQGGRMIGGRQRGCEIRWEWKCWQKCWLAAFVLLKDGKKGLRSPWFPTAFPKVGWGPLNAQFYWSGFRQWTHKKRPGHYRNGLAHFPYSVWYLKYVFSTRDLVLTCQCDHKSSWFHEEVVSFMFFFLRICSSELLPWHLCVYLHTEPI